MVLRDSPGHRQRWNINVGLIYGMTVGSLQHRLNKTKEESDKIAEQYWGSFPRIQPWLQEVVKDVEENHYVRYWSGRMWWEESPDMFYRGANAQIQGGAADLMSIAIMRCMSVLDAQGWGSIVNLVHDEIVFEIKDEYLDEAVHVLAKTMEVEDLFGIPFVADASVGPAFGTYEDYEIDTDETAKIVWTEYLT